MKPADQKIFNIGFHKTGTTSLTQFMHDLGYRSLHSVALSMQLLQLGEQNDCSDDTGKPSNFESLIDRDVLHEAVQKFGFFSDNPWPLLYHYLDETYPDSKFILTLRNNESWMNSLKKYSGSGNTRMRQLIYGYGNPTNHIAQYRKIYIRHNKNVQEYFRGKNNLLIIDIAEDNKVIADKLFSFLGINNPGVSFPTEQPKIYT